jgi:hypothetical protein
MQQCSPPPERAHAHGNELFAGFTPVPNTYADTVKQAGGFLFLNQLYQENRLFQLRDNRLPTSVPSSNTHCLFVNTTKLVLSLCPLFPQGSIERETLRQFFHFLPQLLHATGLRQQDVEYSSILIAQGQWRQVWDMALARAAKLQAKREKNPSIARKRTDAEKSNYAHKCATAGNVSKACKIICEEMIPACSDDTVEKLQDLHPERSLDLNLQHVPSLETLNAFWNDEEGAALRDQFFTIAKVRKYFKSCQALGAADIDGWRGREHILHLFMNNDTELHHLIFDELIWPYVMGDFLHEFLPELAGGLLFAFLKNNGGLRPLLCGSIWRRCAARLISDCTRTAAHTFFTTTYPNFMQCAGGLQDGATRCAQLLNMLHDLPTDAQDPDNPVAFINTDIQAAFQEMCRQTSFDTLTGKATQPYDDGRVQPGDEIPTIEALRPFHGYFNAMHSTASNNRYYDHRGHPHHVKGTTGGQQGDGLEMVRYSLSQHNIVGRVLDRHRDARAAGFADDLTLYAKLETALKVLVELRQRLGEDAKLRFNMDKVKIYIPGVTRERARELVLHHIDRDNSLESLRALYDRDVASPELDIITVTGLKCVGVPIGTPAFVNAFVRSKAHAIEQDVQKLRIVKDSKIHYDLLRFCEHTRFAFLARNVPPHVMMRPDDAGFDLGRGDWGSGILQRSDAVPVPVLIQSSIVHAILQRGLGDTFATLSPQELAWCSMIVELPHHKGGLGITPLQASGMAAFYSATAHLVSWLGSLPHASEWVTGQNLDDPNSWNSSAFQTLKELHGDLLTHYKCIEWAPPPADDAPVPDAPAQGRDVTSVRPLPLPPLNLLASLRVRQGRESGEVTERPSLPPQRQVTKHIMHEWAPHKQTLLNPPTARMIEVHRLHHVQSVLMCEESSALRGNMPQHNDAEGGRPPRLTFSPVASVWGQMGRAWTTGGRGATRTTEVITEDDYVAFFHQFFGLTKNPALAPFANVQCPCQRYFMGGEGAWDHINSCLYHAANWTSAHNHVLRALERVCNDAGLATTHKRVLTSEGHRRADLEIRGIRVAERTDLLVDVTIRHDFIGSGRNGQTQGQLRNPNNPDRILESAAADKIREYRDPYRRNRHVAFLPACMSTSGRIHGEFLRLLYFIANKQADDYFEALGYQPLSKEFCHRRGVFFQQNRGTIGMACAQAVALRGAPTTARRHVAAPRRPPPLHMAYDDHDRNVSHIQGFA